MPRVTVALLLLFGQACNPDGAGSDTWDGTIDTLPTGQIVVVNTTHPAWPSGQEWRVIEEVRIGAVEGAGPDLFGGITSMELDPLGRIWVLEGQAQELRVFARDGAYVRTIGRRGGGPGEFARATHVQLGPDGNMWVVDPQNNRVSRFDTAGGYLDGRPSPGGFVMIPWPGGFDAAGTYYSPIPVESEEMFSVGLVRYDTVFTPLDTIAPLADPETREIFELRRDGNRTVVPVPFTGLFTWLLAPSGTIWGLLTGRYRFFQLTLAGDTLRTVTRAFAPVPVTEDDLEDARENLEWFTQAGGHIDLAKVPRDKPATEGDLLFDDMGNIWVQPVVPRGQEGRVLHVFDPEGRYLGAVELPFRLARPFPVFRGNTMIAVTQDELEVPFVVVARIERP